MEYDDSTGSAENGTVLASSTICSFHTGKTRANILAGALTGDNRRKNRMLEEILNRFPALMGKTDENGNLVFKNDAIVTWSFSGQDDSRVITVTIGGGVSLNASQKTTLQNAVNTRFGAGKIVIS